ncbi:hypothetical protein HDU81_009494 [Chytriomyces hyalinus]|nr:hypothetical protein HDU81_009494 [Chytriomyces hyalinus]
MLQLIFLALHFARTISAHGYMISPGGLNNKATFGAVRGFGGDNPDILQNPANPNNLCKGLPKGRVVPISLGGNGASYSVGLSISAHHPGPCSMEIIDPASNKIVEIGAGDNCATNPANQFDWTFTLKNMDQVTCTNCIMRWVWSSSNLVPKEFYQTCSDITLTKAGGNGPAPPQPPQQPSPQPQQPSPAPAPKPNPPSPAPKPNPPAPQPKPNPPPSPPQPTSLPAPKPNPQPPTTGGNTHTPADCKISNEFLCVQQCGKVLIHCTGAGTGVETGALDGDNAVCNNGRIDFKSNCVV